MKIIKLKNWLKGVDFTSKWTGWHVTNGVFALPKVEEQRQIFWLETTSVVQVNERAFVSINLTVL